MNFVVECYCGVEEVRRISADFALSGVFEREPLSNQFPDKLIFAPIVFARQQLSVLVSNGARGARPRLAGAFCLDLAFPSCSLLPYSRSRGAVSGVFTTGK